MKSTATPAVEQALALLRPARRPSVTDKNRGGTTHYSASKGTVAKAGNPTTSFTFEGHPSCATP
jgi:hypothetical protein